MPPLVDIFLCNGFFLVFDPEQAIELRRRKIVWQLVGATPLGPTLPCLVDHYSIQVCLNDGLANFKHLTLIDSISHEHNKKLWSSKLEEIRAQSEEQYLTKRAKELERKNMEASSHNVRDFDETKLKLVIPQMANLNLSSFIVDTLDKSEVIPHLRIDRDKARVHLDLYRRGFYLTPGSKFGTDFLAYQGDPIRYHATFAVRLVPGNGGVIDLSKINYNEINVLQRLCHSASKILILAVSREEQTDPAISYWTLNVRCYIDPESIGNYIESIDPMGTRVYLTKTVLDVHQTAKKHKT